MYVRLTHPSLAQLARAPDCRLEITTSVVGQMAIRGSPVQVRELGPLISHSSQEISIPGILNPKIYSLVLAGNNISYSPSQ
jgi:hypothetical protein